MALTGTFDSVKQLKNTGGTKAPPSGPSVAGQMVKNNRATQRAVNRAPSRTPRPPSARRSGGGQSRRVPTPSKPYNALESQYGTQAQFNKGVKQTTEAEYKPELDELNHEQQGEEGLHNQRQADNVNTYAQYSQQAQQGFEQAKSSLAEIAARQNAGSQAGQQALQAALSNTGVSGLQGVSNPSSFMNEASGFGNEGSQVLGADQSSIVSELGKNAAAPGAGLAAATQEEGARNAGVLQEIAGKRSSALARIPGDEAKVRQELGKQEQERQANKLQSQLAGSKLGLEKTEGVRKNQNERAALQQKATESRENSALNIQKLAQEAGLESQKLVVEREKIHAEVQKAKTKEQKAAAEIAGKRFDHGLEIMVSYLKENPKTEYRPGAPNAQQLATEGRTEYRRNAQHLYNILTQQGNLTAPEAFRLMKSSGNGYVEQFATEHERTFNAANKGRNVQAKIKAHPLTPLHKGK